MRGNDFMELRAFELVARKASFSRASEELGVSRAALSQSVKALETRLGVQLLIRTTRTVYLTDAGRELLDRLSPALLDLVFAVDNIDRFRDHPVGHVKVASDRVGLLLYLHPVAAEFAELYPEISLEISVDDGIQDFVANGSHAAVREQGAVDLNMVAVDLGPTTRRILVASADYIARFGKPAGVEDIRAHKCILVKNAQVRQANRWKLFSDGRNAAIQVGSGLLVSEDSLVIDAVANGMGIGLVIEELVIDRIATGEILHILDSFFAPGPTYQLCFPKHPFQKRCFNAFIHFMRERWAKF